MNRIEELIADSYTPEEPSDFRSNRSGWFNDVIPFYGALLHREEAIFLAVELEKFLGDYDEIVDHAENVSYNGNKIRFLTESDGIESGLDIIHRHLQDCDYIFQREKSSFPPSWKHREAAT